MEPARHLELLRLEGDRLAATSPDGLNAAVPRVADMTVERVLRHTGKVHRWVCATLEAGPGAKAAPLESLPKGPACIEAYAKALDEVIAALSKHDPNETAWTFGGPGDVAFWIRRQAHEVTVHRVDVADAVHASGGAEPVRIEDDAALDGIDEWLNVFLQPYWSSRNTTPPAEVRGTYRLLSNTAAWDLQINQTVTASLIASVIGEANVPDTIDCRATADPHDLLLALWRRRALDVLEVSGQTKLITALLDQVRI